MSDVKSTGKRNNTDYINDPTGNDLAYPYLTLRAHHLLCIPQYQGNGYSEVFCLQMDNVIKMLQEHRRKLVLLCRPDMLCMYCPNLMQENTYLPHLHKDEDAGELLAEREVGNSRKNGGGHCEKETEIIRKDRTLLEGLHIEEGAAYDAEEIMGCGEKNFTILFEEKDDCTIKNTKKPEKSSLRNRQKNEDMIKLNLYEM